MSAHVIDFNDAKPAGYYSARQLDNPHYVRDLKLRAYDDLYLYIARPMDPRVINAARLTADNAREYHNLEDSRLGTQVAFGLFTGTFSGEDLRMKGSRRSRSCAGRRTTWRCTRRWSTSSKCRRTGSRCG